MVIYSALPKICHLNPDLDTLFSYPFFSQVVALHKSKDVCRTLRCEFKSLS